MNHNALAIAAIVLAIAAIVSTAIILYVGANIGLKRNYES
jgi:hypothetical protein